MGVATRSKYGNQKVKVDGITFDSKAEAMYYNQLKWMKANKQIKDFELQPRFELLPSFSKNGKHYQNIEYIADFKVIKADGSYEIIDVKGKETEVFLIKQKLFERIYLDTVKVLKLVDGHGFMDMDEYKKLEKEAKKRVRKAK
ncbi:DUF1064 domain-containing protein [Bacillus sp. JJ722]|uniref:DUF1064 domain-containing protein n=1 Tax=Bacillus sp. JJ722 TaxID=3122973 RepID=UPI002FFEF09F